MLFSTAFQVAVSAMIRSPTLARARGMMDVWRKERSVDPILFLDYRVVESGILSVRETICVLSYISFLFVIQSNKNGCYCAIREGQLLTPRAGQSESPVSAI